jgi:hypothetical protein
MGYGTDLDLTVKRKNVRLLGMEFGMFSDGSILPHSQ